MPSSSAPVNNPPPPSTASTRMRTIQHRVLSLLPLPIRRRRGRGDADEKPLLARVKDGNYREAKVERTRDTHQGCSTFKAVERARDSIHGCLEAKARESTREHRTRTDTTPCRPLELSPFDDHFAVNPGIEETGFAYHPTKPRPHAAVPVVTYQPTKPQQSRQHRTSMSHAGSGSESFSTSHPPSTTATTWRQRLRRPRTAPVPVREEHIKTKERIRQPSSPLFDLDEFLGVRTVQGRDCR